MEVGLFVEWPNPRQRPWLEVFNEGLDEIRCADELGFDFVLIAEHHFSNYGMAPAPMLEALAIAQATTRIRIGTGVAVLPEWQPVRLAEEMAIVDQLSGGRLIAGFGRGFVPLEHAGFGGNIEDSRQAFDESLEVLLKAWTEDDFTFDGQFVRVGQPTTVLPRPLQRPHPPLWLAGASSESADLAGRLDMTPIVSIAGGMDRVREQHRAVATARERYGRPASSQQMVAYGYAHVAATDAEARRSFAAARWQRDAVASMLAGAVAAGAVDIHPAGDPPDDDALAAQMLVGSPATVVRRIFELRDAGATHLAMLMQFGGLDHSLVMESIRLFAEEVLPYVRDLQPSALVSPGRDPELALQFPTARFRISTDD